MCPLRYVVLGVSLILGIILYFWTGSSDADDDELEVDSRLLVSDSKLCKKCDDEGCEVHEKEIETRPRDLITGRYIYNIWKRAKERKEHGKARAIVGSVAAAFIGTCVGTVYYFL